MATGNFTAGDVFCATDARTVGRTPSTAFGRTWINYGSSALALAGLGAAPNDADYLVKTANSGLSAERVVTDTASIVWDWGTGGQAKANVQFGTTASVACAGNDARLSDARTPTAHKTSHQDGGSDEINVTGLSGLLADAQTPATHGSTHLPGGSDEVFSQSAAIPNATGGAVIDDEARSAINALLAWARTKGLIAP